MNHKFGGGKQPTGTPSLGWSCVVVIASLLAGASVVHNIFKPDLTLPPLKALELVTTTSRRNNESSNYRVLFFSKLNFGIISNQVM
ncbi:hypothetical protein IFM89_036635 [Coptis chinensis]|uniref:Uncharacterized protein n=1 Tax=Coptis chinensis TaxID=261450 RepID=A0A835HJ84_9MAGN|nr:hypothetical protein IFM89_036635 [Coptis chinensis]